MAALPIVLTPQQGGSGESAQKRSPAHGKSAHSKAIATAAAGAKLGGEEAQTPTRPPPPASGPPATLPYESLSPTQQESVQMICGILNDTIGQQDQVVECLQDCCWDVEKAMNQILAIQDSYANEVKSMGSPVPAIYTEAPTTPGRRQSPINPLHLFQTSGSLRPEMFRAGLGAAKPARPHSSACSHIYNTANIDAFLYGSDSDDDRKLDSKESASGGDGAALVGSLLHTMKPASPVNKELPTDLESGPITETQENRERVAGELGSLAINFTCHTSALTEIPCHGLWDPESERERGPSATGQDTPNDTPLQPTSGRDVSASTHRRPKGGRGQLISPLPIEGIGNTLATMLYRNKGDFDAQKAMVLETLVPFARSKIKQMKTGEIEQRITLRESETRPSVLRVGASELAIEDVEIPARNISLEVLEDRLIVDIKKLHLKVAPFDWWLSKSAFPALRDNGRIRARAKASLRIEADLRLGAGNGAPKFELKQSSLNMSKLRIVTGKCVMSPVYNLLLLCLSVPIRRWLENNFTSLLEASLREPNQR